MTDLKTLRLRKFLTQRQLAERVGVPYQTVQRWESGTSTPRPGHLERLAEALDITGAEIVEAVRITQEEARVKSGTP